MMAVLLVSCSDVVRESPALSCRYATCFDIVRMPSEKADVDSVTAVVTISPFDGSRDTLVVEHPLANLVCMSSSQVAGLAAIGADSVISAVSGLRFISTPSVRSRDAGTHDSPNPIYDVGYDSALDFERIMTLEPDVVLAYTVSGAEPPYLSRLRSLGVRVLVLHDHLESHPLARAEYVRLYGSLTGRMAEADSLFEAVCNRYFSLVVSDSHEPVRVLMNIPYADSWYIPGGDSYMSRLVRDAGGIILGAEKGNVRSRVVRMEYAYMLSQQADMWLHPGHCSTRHELSEWHHAFPSFGPLINGQPIYNNTLRNNPEGGNDFWESGSVRPDLILKDLRTIFSTPQGETADSLVYYFKVE